MTNLLSAFYMLLNKLRPTLEFTWLGTGLQLETRTNSGLPLVLTTSDGSSDTFTGTLYKNTADAGLKTSGIAISQPGTVDILAFRSAGVTSVNGPEGTADFSAFTNLVTCALINSECNVFRATMSYGVDFTGANCAGKPLDISGVNASEIRIGNSRCTRVIMPVATGYIGAYIISGHACEYPVRFPYSPSTQHIYFDQNYAGAGKGITEFDVSNCPNAYNLQLREAKINGLKSVPGQRFREVNLIFNDFSQPYGGVAGRPESFVEFVTNCKELATCYAFCIGLSAANIEALCDVLISSNSQRSRAYIDLSYGSVNNHYLRKEYESQRACEPLVVLGQYQKWQQVQALGHNVAINPPVFDAVILSDTTVQITLLNSTNNITIWEIGDTVNCTQSFNPDLMPGGEKTVLSGSGKVWVLSNNKNPIYNGQFIGNSGSVVVVGQPAPAYAIAGGSTVQEDSAKVFSGGNQYSLTVAASSASSGVWTLQQHGPAATDRSAYNTLAGAEYNFAVARGTGFTLKGFANADGCPFDVYINGNLVGSGSCYNASPTNNKTYFTISGLTKGYLEVKVVKTSGYALLCDTIQTFA